MKVNEAFPSAYLKVDDVSGKGEEYTIDGVNFEIFTDPETQEKEKKPVMSFQGVEKRFILNKTNWNRIANILGDESDDWTGKKITLRLEKVEAFGKSQDAIRVVLVA